MPNKGRFRKGWYPSRVRQMTLAEAAWVGAIIEGEGTILTHEGTRQITSITVWNNDVELISTLLRFTGTGAVAPRNYATKFKSNTLSMEMEGSKTTRGCRPSSSRSRLAYFETRASLRNSQ